MVCVWGLSPRVRGNRVPPDSEMLITGSIPACAGEPVRETDAGCRTRVYPRVCGGTIKEIDADKLEKGLSPRVRGNQHLRCGGWMMEGSIPACAGEPTSLILANASIRVYPRVCGGTVAPLPWITQVWGLSPRVRGNLLHRQRHGRGEGSIPACAGEPRLLAGPRDEVRVYPRVCGGTAAKKGEPSGIQGLSPRVRGNHSKQFRGSTGRGSIPACAGEPAYEGELNRFDRVYPRVCGGTA